MRLAESFVAAEFRQRGHEACMAQGHPQQEHAPSNMHGTVVASPATALPQTFEKLCVRNGCEKFLDGAQAGAIFQAVPGEEGLGHGNDHRGPPCVMVANGTAPIYTANDPRTRGSVVEKSKKMATRSKNSAEKIACCGEGHFQPTTNTFNSNNLRTTQTAQYSNQLLDIFAAFGTFGPRTGEVASELFYSLFPSCAIDSRI